MSLFGTLTFALGAAWISGINLYATVATLGLLGRFAHLPLPGELAVLTNGWVIGIALALYTVEFVADKVPWIDTTWDMVHTFIRVPAGAALAAAAFGDFDKGVQAVALLLGGGLALSSHGTKAAVRAVINASPEPFSNIAASVAEDGLAVASVFLTAFYPVLMIVVVAGGLMFTFLLLPRTVRYFRTLRQRFSGKTDGDADR